MTHPSNTQPLFDPPIVRRAIIDAFRKLDPRQQARNPVIFVVAVGAMMTSAILIADLLRGGSKYKYYYAYRDYYGTYSAEAKEADKAAK